MGIELRRCPQCTCTLPEEEYQPHAWALGKGRACRACHNKRQNTYREANIKQVRTAGREYERRKGVLCARCNRILGAAREDSAILQRLISYLEKRGRV